MAKKLAEIPKCKLCGKQVLGARGQLCKSCQLAKTREGYQKAIKAEEEMAGSNDWLKGYSPWKNIVAIPVIIAMLIILVIAIFFIGH